MARPLTQLDADQIRTLAELGCTYEEIAAVLKCSVDTLERRFVAVIQEGRDHGRCSLRRAQWRRAENGNVTMLIWLGKQWLGQKDHVQSHVAADVNLTSGVRIVTDAQLDEWLREQADLGREKPAATLIAKARS